MSEQLARRLKLAVGDALDIPTEGENWSAAIVGIYPDYGNPNGQLRVDIDAFKRHWPLDAARQFFLRVAPANVAGLIRDLRAEMAGLSALSIKPSSKTCRSKFSSALSR